MALKLNSALISKGSTPEPSGKPKPEKAELTHGQKLSLKRAQNLKKKELAKTKQLTKPTKANLKRAANVRILKKNESMREAFAEVFRDLQHTDKFNLKVFAMKNPKEFYMICAKLIPQEITGAGGGPIQIRSIVFQ